jgi:hypothetical protein
MGVSLPACLTDDVVGRHCPARVEQQREHTGVWKWMTVILPSVAPLATAADRALSGHAASQRSSTNVYHARVSPEVRRGSRKRTCATEPALVRSPGSSVAECDVALCVAMVA